VGQRGAKSASKTDKHGVLGNFGAVTLLSRTKRGYNATPLANLVADWGTQDISQHISRINASFTRRHDGTPEISGADQSSNHIVFNLKNSNLGCLGLPFQLTLGNQAANEYTSL